MLHATGEDGASCRSFTKENGRGKRKRSLGCARDDETGETLLHVFFIPLWKPTSAPSGHLLPEEEGRMPASLHRHFERTREIFFVPFFHDPFAKPFRGSTASVLPRYGVSRSLLSNTLRLTANEKDPSTALGMTKRRKTSSHFFSSRYESQPPPRRGG